MPHSSGGGSHGGGSHGGGSHGSSGPRVSRSYYPGARRYLRHHRNSGLDEYVYASSMPRRANLSSIIILIIFFAIFALGIGASTFNDMPKRLNGLYDNPAVHDDIDVIKDDEALTQTLKDYYVLTGICPVVYTVYDEQWSSRNPNLDVIYEDLETYTYFKYVDNFEDEKHFVIVYSVPMEGQELYEQGKIDVPDYSWEAVQGDDTDPIITESMFKKFSDIVQVNLEKGRDPGKAFEAAFEYAFENAESKLNPSVGSWIANSLSSMFPLLFVAGIFILMIVISIKNYKKDRDVEYTEVPLDGSEGVSGTGVGGPSVSGYAANSSGYSRSFSETTSTMSKVGSVFSIIFMIPFLITGVGITVVGLATIKNADSNIGIFFIGFGILWSALSFYMFFKTIKNLVKSKNKADVTSLTAEYPKVEYPKAEYPNAEYPSAPAQPQAPQAEFDPQFFQTAKSNIEDDDEEYKRMKRKGYE